MSDHKKGIRQPSRGATNWVVVGDGTATLDLGDGRTLIIDAAEVGVVAGMHWWIKKSNRTCYARTTVYRDGKWSWIFIHHVIVFKPVPPLEIDHRNRNGLDNRRENLRVVTSGQNNYNAARRRSASGFIGVHLHGRRWVARVGKRRIGNFPDAESAAKARDAEVLRICGPDSTLNFPIIADDKRKAVAHV